MSIGIPRFSYAHAIRENTGGLSVAGSPSDAARLHDERTKALVTIGAGTSRRVDLDRGTSALRTPVDRVLIPGTHNLHRTGYSLRLIDDDDGTFGTGSIILDLADGKTGGADRLGPAPGTIAWDLEETRARGLRLFLRGGLVDAELGELWWTRARAPGTSIAPGWDRSHQAALVRSETFSGATFTRERGETRRVFTLDHQFLPQEDAALYRELLRQTGYGAHPFWYDPPEEHETLLSGLGEDSANWTAVQGSASTATGSRGDSAGAIEHTASASGNQNLERTFGTSLDLRGKWLRVRFLPGETSWITADSTISVLLETDPTGTLSRSVFRIGHEVNAVQEAGVWYDVYVDCSLDPDFTFGSGPCDLANVDRIVLQFSADSSGHSIRWDDLYEVDPLFAPALVELAEIPPEPEVQQSRVPAGGVGPKYRQQLRMIEVTT